MCLAISLRIPSVAPNAAPVALSHLFDWSLLRLSRARRPMVYLMGFPVCFMRSLNFTRSPPFDAGSVSGHLGKIQAPSNFKLTHYRPRRWVGYSAARWRGYRPRVVTPLNASLTSDTDTDKLDASSAQASGWG